MRLYLELVLEFYSTLHFDAHSEDFTAESMTFQLGGQPRSMSIVEFAQAVELYTADEVHNPHFITHLVEGRRDRYTSAQVAEFWGEIGSGQYGARAPSYRLIRSPIHRLVHRMLSSSIVARREGPEKVHQPDFFYLHSIIQGTLVNVPWCLAYWMSRHATGSRDTSSICGGQYITRLARWFGIGDDILQTCTPVSPGMEFISVHRLIEIGLIQPAIGGNEFVWTPPLGHEQQPQQGVRGAGRAGRAGGRARGRGHEGGYYELQQRMERMELEHSHHFAYQDSMLQAMMQHYQLPWQQYVPYQFGEPSHPPGQEEHEDSD